MNVFDKFKKDSRPTAIRKLLPVPKTLTDDDLLVISHKLEDGQYSTAAITLKELRNYILGNE